MDRGFAGLHTIGHGLIKAMLTVFDNLPPELAQDLFAQGGTYGAVMRFSTGPGDILDNAISAPRGLAIKILDVPGDRLAASKLIAGGTPWEGPLFVNRVTAHAANVVRWRRRIHEPMHEADRSQEKGDELVDKSAVGSRRVEVGCNGNNFR